MQKNRPKETVLFERKKHIGRVENGRDIVSQNKKPAAGKVIAVQKEGQYIPVQADTFSKPDVIHVNDSFSEEHAGEDTVETKLTLNPITWFSAAASYLKKITAKKKRVVTYTYDLPRLKNDSVQS